MRVKSVTYEDYTKAKIGNENKGYGDIIDIAWRNSPEGKRIKESRKKIFIAVSFGCFVLLPSVLALAPATKAFADTLDIQTLIAEDRSFVLKLQFCYKCYIDTIRAMGIKRSAPLFADILEVSFNSDELSIINELAEGLSFEQFLKLIPSF